MNFCSLCGQPVTMRVPEGDHRPRHVCTGCGHVHYQNPKIVGMDPHSDRCGVAMLYGELGIGKSSLLTKALSEIGRERLIIRARCDPAINSLSYWPVKNLILRECRAHSSTSQMVSEFFSKEGSSSDAFQINAEEIMLGKFSKDNQFSFLVKCLLSLANEPGGLILCVEDLEWADADTLELFLYLSRYTQSNKILLIGSYCCPESNNLTKFLPKLGMADGLLGTIKVQGVSEKETGSIVRMWMGELKADPRFITQLHRLSGGNPLFISEILRWISESEISADSLINDTSLSLPSTISKIINYRLSLLNQIARRVLEVGAAIGHIFKIDQVSELSDLSVLLILDAVDELVNRHFLLPQSNI